MMMRRGQTMVEYVLALAALIMAVGVMGVLVTAAYRAAHRTTTLVRMDVP